MEHIYYKTDPHSLLLSYLEEAWQIHLFKLQFNGFWVHFCDSGSNLLSDDKGLAAVPPRQVHK